MRIHSLMSASVTLPSAPPGFTTVNGRATAPAPVPAAEDGALLLFLPQLPAPSSFSACRDENFARRAVKKLLLVTAVKCDCVRQGRHGRTFRCRALGRAVGASRQALGDTGVSGPWVHVAVRRGGTGRLCLWLCQSLLLRACRQNWVQSEMIIICRNRLPISTKGPQNEPKFNANYKRHRDQGDYYNLTEFKNKMFS